MCRSKAMDEVNVSQTNMPPRRTLFSRPVPRNLAELVYHQRDNLPLVANILHNTQDEDVMNACLHAISHHGTAALREYGKVARRGYPQPIWLAVTMYNLGEISLLDLVKFLDKCYKECPENVRREIVNELFLLLHNVAIRER